MPNMKTVLRIMTGLCLAGATALVCQGGVQAQNFLQPQNGPPADAARYAAPAQGLEEAPVLPGLPRLTVTSPGAVAHVFPTVKSAAALAAAGALSGPLLYHAGGSVMQPFIKLYLIFWGPATLQNGNPTGFDSTYVPVIVNVATGYPGHDLASNNTQYYQTISGVTNYSASMGGAAGGYFDTAAFPSSGCTDTATPGNCITDAQIRAEIQRVISLNGWIPDTSSMFILFTSKGEGSCFDSTNASCAYTQYCGYHSFISGTSPIIYANMPYGDATNCQTAGTPSPNGDPKADAAASVLSHEISEAITDPLLNAWFSSNGISGEIGDLCAYVYGTNTWDSAQANQMWSGNFLELQEEYDNHTNSCVQVGP
jgi:hypothetical protein